jgi:hypothetical protein
MKNNERRSVLDPRQGVSGGRTAPSCGEMHAVAPVTQRFVTDGRDATYNGLIARDKACWHECTTASGST